MISYKQFSEILIPNPNATEQQKIAACLSSLDELIAAERAQLNALQTHKKGLLQNLFPQAGETVPKMRFKEFLGEWEVKRLGEVADNVMYGMNAAAIDFDGKNKYIRITDINESTRLFSPNPVTSPDGDLDEKYLVKVGDILFARTGASVGKSYLHQKENGIIYFAGFLIRFTIKNAVPYFVYLQTLTSHYQKWVLKTSMRSGQPGINAEEYKSFSLLIPKDLKEQEKIATCLSSIDALISAQVEKIAALQLHKKGMMQGLFPNVSLSPRPLKGSTI
jgi:type I restriction enzyme, S subunit